MTSAVTLAVVFGLGVATSFVWAWRFFAVERRQPFRSALWDGATMALAYAPLQVWAASSDNWLVLAAYIVGNMVGTAIVVGRERG